MNPVILTAIGVGVSTLFGSALGFFIKKVSHKANDTIIGFCSGVMLSAAVLGLIMPAFDGLPNNMLWLPIVGVFSGALLLNILDLVTPHLHHITGKPTTSNSIEYCFLCLLLRCINFPKAWQQAWGSMAKISTVQRAWLLASLFRIFPKEWL